jgi:hypothetical protein
MEPSPAISQLERLTHTAKDAAEQGRWDIVGDCYRERESAIVGTSLLPHEADRLMTIDGRIREQALVAKKALASLIRESSMIRRRLKGLRQGTGAASSDSGMILLEA